VEWLIDEIAKRAIARGELEMPLAGPFAMDDEE